MSRNQEHIDEPVPQFTEEWIAVGDLEVDPNIQRYGLNLKKVSTILKVYNPNALGVLTVSRRNRVTNIILDGWHRWQVEKERTDNQGKVLCHVYKDLTRAQEAQMFLDLNFGNQPNLLEKFRARIITEDPVAVGINNLTKSYGWTVSPASGNGSIACVGALERIWRASEANEAEPNWLQLALLCVTRAWGMDRFAAQAVLLEGIAALFAEHGADVDVDRVINKLKTYPGGPMGLHTDATAMASLRRTKVFLAVAELVANEYNKGKSSKKLPPLKKRRL